MLTHSKTNTQ